jgi:drug/metabolite transporter (DMT)-like permease
MHLLLPLLASILLVCGLIFCKRAGELGVNTVTTLFATNILSSLAFSGVWFFGGTMQPWAMWWQPAVVALLFWLGQTFTFLAVMRGDVSIATPVLGLKVVAVAWLLVVFGDESLPGEVWLAATLAAIGIATIQWTGRGDPKRALSTIFLALCGASSFAAFDVLNQTWSPTWGTGRFLPIVYWIVGLTSLLLAPWVDWPKLREAKILRCLLPGAGLVALQATCIVLAVSLFGDAARINVVYTLRGLWAVGLAWLAAKIWGGAEAEHADGVMVTRAVGACLLTLAVILVVLK